MHSPVQPLHHFTLLLHAAVALNAVKDGVGFGDVDVGEVDTAGFEAADEGAEGGGGGAVVAAGGLDACGG